MKEVIRRKKVCDKRLPSKNKVIRKKAHQKFGTSIAEKNFAHDFLDKLGINYIWQFEAREIGRFFDFYLTDYRILIEFDGTYWHSDDRVYESKDLTPTQKKNKRVDEQKNQWALLHCIPLIRIKEKDVNENPDQVMKMLKERLKIQLDFVKKENEMNKRHVNKLNNFKNQFK
jgi:very-short-patch-repair endonuclease